MRFTRAFVLTLMSKKLGQRFGGFLVQLLSAWSERCVQTNWSYKFHKQRLTRSDFYLKLLSREWKDCRSSASRNLRVKPIADTELGL